MDAARELFNAQGISQITIRQIAQHLGISSGNLNYHFKKREEILHALYFEMVAVFDERIEALPNQKLSLAMVHAQMKSSMKRMLDYRFIWTDLYNILRDDTQIRAHFQEVYQKRLMGYEFLFKAFEQQKLMRKAAFATEYHLLAIRMINYSDAWLNTLSLYDNNAEDKLPAQLDILFGMLFPYLTKTGQQDFRGISDHLF